MDLEQTVQQAMNGAPQVPPAEWMMVGFSVTIGDIELGGETQKALVFWHASSPNGVRFIFPMSKVGARQIGNQLLGNPVIQVPGQ